MEAYELGHDSLGWVQLLLEFFGCIYLGNRKRPEVRSICRVLPPRQASGGCTSGQLLART